MELFLGHEHQVLMAPTYNKYDHMDPPINVLTLFEYQNEEALQQVAFDFLMTNGAIVVHNDGTVWAHLCSHFIQCTEK